MGGIHPADLVNVANSVMLFAVMFALGLGQSLEGLLALWRQPALLARSLLAVWVLVPLVALAVARLVPGLTEPTQNALLLMAAAASAPLVVRKVAKIPSATSYAVSLQITVAALAVVTVPLSVALLGEGRIAPLEVMRQVLQAQLVALVLGVFVRHWRPALADRLLQPVARLGTVLLVLLVLVSLVFIGPRLLDHINAGAVLAIAVVVIASLAMGHLLGGPRPDTRPALALIASTRNLGLAMLLAGANLAEPAPTLGVILLYTTVTQVLHIPYLVWYKRRTARQARAAPA